MVRRLSAFSGMALFLAPAPEMLVNSMIEIEIEITSKFEDAEQMLLYWKTSNHIASLLCLCYGIGYGKA